MPNPVFWGDPILCTFNKPTADTVCGVMLDMDLPSRGSAVKIHSIDPERAAAGAGLNVGDKVISINGDTVTSHAHGTMLFKAAVGDVQVMVARQLTGPVTEKMVILRHGEGVGCDPTLENPPYDEWFAPLGVSQADYDELMTKIIETINTHISRVNPLIPVIIISCGFCGVCCVMAMEEAMKGKIQVALDEFNGKYPNIAGNHHFVKEPAIVFRAPAPAASVGVVAAVPAPVVMARDDPEEKLAKLKSMLDKGLITQAEYDFKKAEVLAGM
jgi:hypothetical protein